MKGRVVPLHFWASWCKPCTEEFPVLRKLSEHFADRGLTLLAVAEDSEKRSRAFAEKRGLASAVLIDRWGAVGRDYFSPAALEYFERVLEER